MVDEQDGHGQPIGELPGEDEFDFELRHALDCLLPGKRRRPTRSPVRG